MLIINLLHVATLASPAFDIKPIEALTQSAPTDNLLKYLRILQFLNTFQYKIDNELLNASDYQTFLVLIDLLRKRLLKKDERTYPVYWYSRQG